MDTHHQGHCGSNTSRMPNPKIHISSIKKRQKEKEKHIPGG
jgi:hypothetical protein